MAGVYLNIPYCVKKCDYCDFVSFPLDGRLDAYVDALIAEIELSAQADLLRGESVDTIFFGGGTPSLLDGKQIARILDALRTHFPVTADAECSLECNPGTATRANLTAYRESGVNRLSVGLQAAQDTLLSSVGRIHSYDQFCETMRFARDAGFHNINVDVMHGLPDQTQAAYLETLRLVCDMDVQHVSAYALTINDDTPLGMRVKTRKTILPDEDALADMQDAGIAYLESRGLLRYEISNFARAGFCCRHNVNYWQNGAYLGLGVAAHSAARLCEWTRWSNVETVGAYLRLIQNGKRPLQETIRLYPADEMFECVMLGLRMIKGVDRAAFRARFGLDVTKAYPDAVEQLQKRGWINVSPAYFALNRRGLDLQNEALGLFM